MVYERTHQGPVFQHPSVPRVQVERLFPAKDMPLLVGCSDGQAYSIDALSALEDAGYTRLVGLRG